MPNATPVTSNVLFESFRPCSQDSFPFHYLLTFLSREDPAPFPLLIIIIISLCVRLSVLWALRDSGTRSSVSKEILKCTLGG